MLLLALLIGIVAGLRAMTAPAAAAFAARFTAHGVTATPLAFMGYAFTPWIFAVLAAVELVTDQLPSTPSRKVPVQFGARIVMGGLSGATFGAAGGALLPGLVAGAVGAVIGTFGGAALRTWLAALFARDLPAALIEDAIAIRRRRANRVRRVMDHFDAIIVGAGQAGPALAARLTDAGQRVAVIERGHVGGTCVNTGCKPTKTMVASAYVAHLARRGADFGVHAGPVSVDMAKVAARARKIILDSRGSNEQWLAGMPGLELIRGHARFEAPKTIRVGDRLLTAERIFLNVGRPALPFPICPAFWMCLISPMRTW